jgi:hypothetical protein
MIDVSAASQRSSGTWTSVLIVQPASKLPGRNGRGLNGDQSGGGGESGVADGAIDGCCRQATGGEVDGVAARAAADVDQPLTSLAVEQLDVRAALVNSVSTERHRRS